MVSSTLLTDYAGLQVGEGTSFPTSPVNGSRFWRTDRHLEYYYDGANSRWLCTHLENIFLSLADGNSPFASTFGGAFRAPNPYAGLYDFLIIDFLVGSYITSAGTWTYTVAGQQAGSTIWTLSTSTAGDTGSSFVYHRATVNQVMSNSGVSTLQGDVTKSSGGNVYPMTMTLQGRKIG